MLNWIDINVDKPFDYTISVPKYRIQHSPQQAAIDAVNYVCENYPPPYKLYVSGGIDSQAMLWSWYISRKPFEAVSYIYNKNMNSHDLNSGMPAFVNKYNIDISYRHIDILEFYKTEYTYYHKKYRCGSPHICAYMYMADQQTDGTVLFSGHNHKFYSKNEWGLYTYGRLSGKSLVPFFLSETHDLHHSLRSKNKSTRSKAMRYNDAGFPVIAQSKANYSGFEKIKDFYEFNYKHLMTLEKMMKRTSIQKSSKVYDVLLRNNLELEYSLDKYFVKEH